MNIENKSVVTLNYRLTVNEDGEEVEVEKTDPARPFVFLFGLGYLLPSFENNIVGKSAGDSFDFFLTAENGYGSVDERNMILIPIDVFCDESGELTPDLLEVGKVLPMMDQEGNKLPGRVMEINEEDVLMDFNHPLAGKELHFTGEITDVRLATSEELEHGHVHGAGGHHH